jgi:hypothetical protein
MNFTRRTIDEHGNRTIENYSDKYGWDKKTYTPRQWRVHTIKIWLIIAVIFAAAFYISNFC